MVKINNIVLEFDDTHLYTDVRSAYLMELADNCKTDIEASVMDSVVDLYQLGRVDFYFDFGAMEASKRICFIPQEPS